MENNEKALQVVNSAVGDVKNEDAENAEYTEVTEEKKAPAPELDGEGLEISMDADLFSGMRESFDSTLRVLLEKITSRNIEEGEINLKLVIGLQEQTVMDKRVYAPSFKYTVTGNYKESVGSKGSFGVPQTYLAKGPDGNYELRTLQDNLFSKEPQDALFKEADNE